MELEGRETLIVGFGKTGEELCRFLLNQGAHVTVSEKKEAGQLSEKIGFWQDRGVVFETGGHQKETFLGADIIFPSPGVPRIPELDEAIVKGVEVLSEIELAFRFLKGRVVGITGTNGKSTTTTLSNKILQNGGIKSYLAGNIGTPLISYVEESENDHIYVTELSSFQLEYVQKFRVYISVLLNLSPDHLDWHGNFKDYFEAKKHLLKLQDEEDITILNRDDPLVWDLREEIKPKVFGFSRIHRVVPGCFIERKWIVCTNGNEERIFPIGDIPLLGVHNQENVLGSTLIGFLFGISSSAMRETVKSFQSLEHRLEEVATLERVVFYNDSKATNVGATLKSLESFDNKIILILGGRDKGGNFDQLKKPIEKHVKKILLIGEAKEKIALALKNDMSIPMDSVSSLREAVELGFASASPGEIVLLAPACTSFDMFQNFEERGRAFKSEVFALIDRVKTKGN
jgi:UDP-N-acetylmuramoylalanine--D-glutamate ligase